MRQQEVRVGACISLGTNTRENGKIILREVVESGRARVVFRELSNLKVQLVWPQEVTFKSAARLVEFAKKRDSSFEILEDPRRVEDDDDDDDGAEASLEKDKKSEEAPAQAVPEPAGAALEPEAKRLRAENGSLTQACDGAVVVAESPDGGSMGGSAADVMAGQAASAVVFPPTHLLMMKTESLCLRSQRAPNAHSGNEYSVLWDRPLGKGSYGTTYMGTAPRKHASGYQDISWGASGEGCRI